MYRRKLQTGTQVVAWDKTGTHTTPQAIGSRIVAKHQSGGTKPERIQLREQLEVVLLQNTSPVGQNRNRAEGSVKIPVRWDKTGTRRDLAEEVANTSPVG